MCKIASRKILSLLLCASFFLQQTGFAAVNPAEFNLAGSLLPAVSARAVDKFRPLHLRSVSYDLRKNGFQLLLDKGDDRSLMTQDIEATARDLLNYFFVGISLPDDAFWVNLRPDAPREVIDPLLAATQVGKILLEADLMLKKDTAGATDPRTPEGREYWNKLYQKAAELYGDQNTTIPSLTRPWIVPDEVIIGEAGDSAYVYKATLKVMLEQDHLKGEGAYSFKDPREKQLNEYSSRLMRETIIPKLTKDINTARRYAPLRQVYYSLILARWFKVRHRADLSLELANKKYPIGVRSRIAYSVEAYYKAYKESFSKGEYRVKEPSSTAYGQVIRSYVSGGIVFGSDGISAAIRRGCITASLPVDLLAENQNILTLHADNSGEEVRLAGDAPSRSDYPVSSKDVPALRATEGIRDGGELSYKEQLGTIRNLLSTVDGKMVTKVRIKEPIVDQLLSIKREGVLLFARRSYAERIARLRDLGARLSRLEYLISCEDEGDGPNKYLFNDSHIATIMQSARGEEEIKGLITSLPAMGITGGTHISQIVQSSRKETEIREILGALRSAGITEGTYLAMILHSSRVGTEVNELIPVLKNTGIRESSQIAAILYSGRHKTEIPKLVESLKELGIQDNSHIAAIVRSSRTEADIRNSVDSLRSLGITNNAHIAQILQTSRSETEIAGLIRDLKGLDITDPSHVALILRTSRPRGEIASLIGTLRRDIGITESRHLAAIAHSAREEAEIIGLIASLKGLGITDHSSISAIIGTSRKEAEIKSLVEALSKMGIRDSAHITRILRSARKQAEIEDLVGALNDVGIKKNVAIAMILYGSRKKAEIIGLIKTLRMANITEESHLALILQSARKEAEIKGLIEYLRSLKISDEYHLALILSSSRGSKEIGRVIGILNDLGISESFSVATVVHTSRTEMELNGLVSALREVGIRKSSHIAVTLQGLRGEAEIRRVVAALRNEGITDGSHCARILSTGRSETEIINVIHALKDLGITEAYHISLILRSGRQEAEIREMVGMLRSLGIKEKFHIAKILATSRTEAEMKESIKTLKSLGITEGYYISLILYSSRTDAEIKNLVELKKMIMRQKGSEYSASFVRDILIGLSLMDEPVPLLNKILSTDFERVRLEIEQMSTRTTPRQFKQEYGEMAVWILKYFGKDFRFLSSFIRGYSIRDLYSGSMEMIDHVVPALDNVENQFEQIFLREILEKAIVGLGSETEREIAYMYLAGYSEDEITLHYPDVFSADVFAKLKQIILRDLELREGIASFTDYIAANANSEAEGNARGAEQAVARDGGGVKETKTGATFGGIDFRALPAARRPANDLRADPPSAGEVIIDADAELSRIRALIDAGIIPSSQRIEECARSFIRNKGPISRTGKALNCIADIFRLEEERASAAPAELKDLLVLIESAVQNSGDISR